MFMKAKDAREADVRRGVVGPGKRVAAIAGQAVVEAIPVLVGIAGDGGIDRASAAVVDHG